MGLGQKSAAQKRNAAMGPHLADVQQLKGQRRCCCAVYGPCFLSPLHCHVLPCSYPSRRTLRPEGNRRDARALQGAARHMELPACRCYRRLLPATVLTPLHVNPCCFLHDLPTCSVAHRAVACHRSLFLRALPVSGLQQQLAHSKARPRSGGSSSSSVRTRLRPPGVASAVQQQSEGLVSEEQQGVTEQEDEVAAVQQDPEMEPAAKKQRLDAEGGSAPPGGTGKQQQQQQGKGKRKKPQSAAVLVSE